MPQQKPLDIHQQELVNIVRAAHQTLKIARKTRSIELARRIAEEKLRSDRAFEQAQIRIKMELDDEVEAHAANLDEALIAAYNSEVPIRRIALDGFGNRYDGGVQQLLVKLRDDGRLGNRDGYQRNTSDESYGAAVSFPKPVDVGSILTESTTITGPTFTPLPSPITLVEADDSGENGVYVPAVLLEMDSRDPWFASIRGNARPGTPYLRATSVTLYEHPATGELLTYESKETGEMTWDHPVARWVKSHYGEALMGFRDATLHGAVVTLHGMSTAATVDDLQQVANLGDQLGIAAQDAEPFIGTTSQFRAPEASE